MPKIMMISSSCFELQKKT